MVNQLRENNNDLPTVDYSDLLAQIIETLQTSSESYFSIIETTVENKSKKTGTSDQSPKKSYQRFVLDIDKIATTVSQKRIPNPLSRIGYHKITTLNLVAECQEKFPSQIRQIQQLLENLLQNAVNQHLQKQSKSPLSPQQFIKQLIVDLSRFDQKKATANFNYPFSTPNPLYKQRLTLDNQSTRDKCLRFHKLTIRVNHGTDFDEQVQEGILNYLDQNFNNCSAEDQEESEQIVEDLYNKRPEPNNHFAKLKRIINEQTLGKLKRQSQIFYLQFLLDQYYQNRKKEETKEEGAIYLQTLIRRLRYIDEFINLEHYADGDYEITQSKGSINYRDILAREDAFKELPVIPLIVGNLGESRLDGAIEFTLGLKLKLNGDVQTSQGESSFQYHLDLLNPDSQLHQDTLKQTFGLQKILKVALLYFFVFACDNPNEPDYHPIKDLHYNPLEKFESNVLPAFRRSETDMFTMLGNIRKGLIGYKVEEKINKLVKFLQKIIKYETLSKPQEKPAYLTLKNRLLKDNLREIIDEQTVFDQSVTGNPKLALKYIDVTEARSQENTFLSIPVTLNISDLHYFLTQDKQSFTMQYDVAQVKALPIIFYVSSHRASERYYKLNQHNCLVFPHQQATPNQQENFFYNFTFSLLTFTTLNILLKKERLFLPILRLDIEKGDSAGLREKFMYNFSKVLAHLLNEQHRSNAQGIDVRSVNDYKVLNAMSSLYSVLPKTFTLPQPTQLDKLAIIIVSSREHDRSWKPEIKQKYSTLMGEVVGILRETNNTIKYRLIQTFSANYDRETLFRQPIVMSDVIQKLYKQGYRHIIYIAKAPYTSTLHLTQNQDDEDLFFMSKDIMRLLKGQYQDLNIYPMFFDKYYVVPWEKLAQSLYIEDTAELTRLAEDDNKMFAVFFNLFNGQAVGEENRNYRGVISYSTLLNFYEGILGDQKIRQGLIDSGQLKQDILQYLTLFHFARYEKGGKKLQLQLKLDPYQNLIGDKSVGNLALIPHAKEKVEFNVLAFLTRVQEILNTKQ
ncbi:hypothetical protein [Spirulina subsalsa]|uniref:hypothetical protein n=1 Tax=Spirulina subsalsa TaxID=54311 RepID=UPI00031D3AE0|nr:hypothetical protein [Spirulina subsalsa]